MSNSSFAVVSNIREWWSNEGQVYVANIEDIESDINKHRALANKINNQTSEGNFFNFLGNVWERATALPGLNKKITALEKEKDGITSLLTNKAAEDGDLLLAAIASEQEVVWLSYASILMGLNNLANQEAHTGGSSSQKYDEAMQQYINLRLYIANNTALPSIFYTYTPKGLEEDKKTPSAAWRFNITT